MSPQPHLQQISSQVADHAEMLREHDDRLAKYDAIIAHLDTLLDMLTRRLDQVSERVDRALEGQELLKQRAESAHRWSTISTAAASSLIVGVLMFALGYVLR